MSDQPFLITKQGLTKLKKELEELKTSKRKEIAERIREAKAFGDLSENSEYEEARNDQALVEGRIIELEQKVKNAQIISEKASKDATVQLGSTVELSINSSKSTETFTIVGSAEADYDAGKISNESPIGNAIIGKETGEVVKVKAPAGEIKVKVLKIK